MTPEWLAEVEARANAAPAGPWWRDTYERGENAQNVLLAADGRSLADSFNADHRVLDHSDHHSVDVGTLAAFEFMAEAREDVPRLVAEVRHARQQRDALAKALRDLMMPDGHTYLCSGIRHYAGGCTTLCSAARAALASAVSPSTGEEVHRG